MMATAPLLTSVCCLERLDRYEHEKVYEMRFQPTSDFPRKNMSIVKHNVKVHDVRGMTPQPSLERNGFTTMQLEANMGIDQFDDRSEIEGKYLPQVGNALKKLLGASRVQIHDYLVRKSDSSYPFSTGKPYQHEQPANLLHIDSTPECSRQIAQRLNLANSELLQKRFQYVTVWKALHGPVRKWPLMVCDTSTVNPDHDVKPRDMIYADHETETALVHHSNLHKFYYISDQTSSEAWVMLQSDSAGYQGVPHTAFANPLAEASDPERQSIEVRTIVFYD